MADGVDNDTDRLYLVMRPVRTRGGVPYDDEVDRIAWSHKVCTLGVFKDEEMAERVADGEAIFPMEADILHDD